MITRRALPFAFTLLFTCSIYYAFATYFSLSLLGHEAWSGAYDALAKALPQWRADIDPPSEISWEGFEIDGKQYMYFGPLPAVLRIVPRAFLQSPFGHWGRIYTLAASLLAVLSGWLLLSRFGRSAGLIAYPSAALIGVALGTPILYLAASGRIYHEAIAWGLAGSLLSLYFYDRWLVSGRTRSAALFSFFAGCALLARITFGLPLYLIIVFSGAAVLSRGGASGRLRPLIAFVLPALCAGTYQLWYNAARFGSVFETYPEQFQYFKPSTFGGFFNLWRLTHTIPAYFGLRLANFSLDPPFIRQAKPQLPGQELFAVWQENVLGLALSSPWLLLLAAIGLTRAVTLARFEPRRAAVAVALMIQALLICAYGYVTQRFAAEILPCLLWLAGWALTPLPKERRLPSFVKLLSALGLGLAVAANILSTLHFQVALTIDSPEEFRSAAWQRLQPLPTLPSPVGPAISAAHLPFLENQWQLSATLRDTAWNGSPLRCQGKVFYSGIGMHANASITIEVPHGYRHFRSLLCLSDEAWLCGPPSVRYEIIDERDSTLWSQRFDTHDGRARVVEVALGESRRLTLRVTDEGDGFDCDHANWLEPTFVGEPPTDASGHGLSP